MKEFSWKREILAGVRHMLLALAASPFALVSQAEAELGASGGGAGLLESDSRAEVIKGSGVFYGWLLLLLAAFGAARLLVVRARRRTPDRFS